jgi:hypothetical protein
VYFLMIDHLIYDTRPLTLVQALTEIRGCRNAEILRADLTTAVERAGSDTEVVHVTRDWRRRTVRRRATWWAPDTWSSASRQHWIDTGRYLTVREARLGALAAA